MIPFLPLAVLYRGFVAGWMLLTCQSVSPKEQEPLQDTTPAENIKTVLLYPYKGSVTAPARTLLPPVKALNDASPLILEFDDLNASYTQYHVKIQHCDTHWRPSRLNDIEYLSAYNDFVVNDYDVSQNTKIPYYHYRFEVPAVRVSGNYVALVYEDYGMTRLAFARRFMVYEESTSVRAAVRQAQDPTLWRTHQQLDFEISYANYPVQSARQEFQVVVRQNYQWATARPELRPVSDNAAGRVLSYRFFRNENTFPAGNEFRFFDIRSTYTTGLGVEKVIQGRRDEALLRIQQARTRTPYLENRDYNGLFVIEGREATNPSVTNDYIRVQFALKADLEGQQPHVVGAFNQWEVSPQTAMSFDKADGLYTYETLLKQGIYDYSFALTELGKPAVFHGLEGNFSDTENVYEVFVYHQPPAARAPRLIGYQVVSSRPDMRR